MHVNKEDQANTKRPLFRLHCLVISSDAMQKMSSNNLLPELETFPHTKLSSLWIHSFSGQLSFVLFRFQCKSILYDAGLNDFFRHRIVALQIVFSFKCSKPGRELKANYFSNFTSSTRE